MVNIVKYGPFPKEDLIGKKFHRLTVIAFGGRDARAHGYWRCECDCGAETMTPALHLKAGKSKSCGCLKREMATERLTIHGGSGTPEHSIYKGMRARCYGKGATSFKYYGARGIVICDRWLGIDGFKNFLSDMGKRPTKKHSIERKDNNGPYSPENCVWATVMEQRRNTSRNVMVSVDGKNIPLVAACEIYKFPYNVAQHRITELGWEPIRAMTTPVRALSNVR